MNLTHPPAFARITEPVAYWAATAPEHPAVIDKTSLWTYAQLNHAACQARDVLRAHGVGPGDRVLIVGDNSAVMIGLMLGTSLAGASIIPLNPRLSDRELDEINHHATPACILFAGMDTPRSRRQAEHFAAHPITIAGLGTIGLAPFGTIGLAVGESGTAADTPSSRDLAALIYTSGTTGRPKGVMLTHGNFTASSRMSGAIRALSPQDRVYSALPISHILGFTGVMLGTFTYGGTLMLASRFDPPGALHAIRHDHATVMIGAPSMFALLTDYAASYGMTTLPPHHLRLIASAGAPLDGAVKSAVEACFGIVLNNGYGITECSPTISQTRIDQPRSDCSVGMLLPGIEARLADETDGIGALQVRGPTVMLGYYRDQAATAAVLDAEGWFDTGDLARFQNDHLFIVGRSREQIVRFGFKIYPAEVEAVLNAHPTVRQSAVIGRGDGAHQDVIAFVEPIADAVIDSRALMDYACRHLADYKRPTEIHLRATLPMGATGKVQKSLLIV